jgi:hypothetical protein
MHAAVGSKATSPTPPQPKAKARSSQAHSNQAYNQGTATSHGLAASAEAPKKRLPVDRPPTPALDSSHPDIPAVMHLHLAPVEQKPAEADIPSRDASASCPPKKIHWDLVNQTPGSPFDVFSRCLVTMTTRLKSSNSISQWFQISKTASWIMFVS